jgi:toxin FitB
VLTQRFSGEPLRLAPAEHAELPSTLARAGVAGGASYDGLVALEAASHDQHLLTLDRRAQDAYRRLGATFTVISD